MKKKLLKKFKTIIRFSNLLSHAANCEARPRQSLVNYCFRKLQIFHALKCNISEECLIGGVIGGIKDETIARTLSSMKFADTNEMYSRIRAMGNVPVLEKKPSNRESEKERRIRRKPNDGNDGKGHKLSDNLGQSSHKFTKPCFNCK